MARTNLPLSGLGAPLVSEGPANLYNAPAVPGLATAGSGGTILAGTYLVVVSYVTAFGETVGSPVGSQVTVGTTSTITITAPATAGAGYQTGVAPSLYAPTGWYAYVSQLGGATMTRQQAAGSPTPLGTNLVLTAPPTSTGANPLTWDPAGTAADQANGMNVQLVTETIPPSYDAMRGVMLRIKNTAANGLNAIIRAGVYPPSMRAFEGDLTVAIPAAQTLWVGPLEHGRHAQQDDSINIDFQAGFTGTITAFALPRNV